MNAIIYDRPGNAKAGGTNLLAVQVRGRLAGELLDDQIELREILAGKPLPEDDVQLAAFFGEKREIALCAADVARKDHNPSRQTRLLNRFKGYTIVWRRVPAVDPTLLAPRYLRDTWAPSPSSPRSRRPGSDRPA